MPERGSSCGGPLRRQATGQVQCCTPPPPPPHEVTQVGPAQLAGQVSPIVASFPFTVPPVEAGCTAVGNDSTASSPISSRIFFIIRLLMRVANPRGRDEDRPRGRAGA